MDVSFGVTGGMQDVLGVVQNVRTRILVDFIPGTRPVLAASF